MTWRILTSALMHLQIMSLVNTTFPAWMCHRSPADTDASLYGTNFHTFSWHCSVSYHVRVTNVVGEIYITKHTCMLHIHSTFYFYFCIQLLQLGVCLLTSLPCVLLWTTLCYQGDRGPGACTTDIPADQVKFLPYWPASVVAGHIDSDVLHRLIV